MPRKQRFKPSRKPKPAEPTMDATTSDNRQLDAGANVNEPAQTRHDGSSET